MSLARVLVVEDERDISDLIIYNLEREGFRAEAAMTGEDGFAKARALGPDLIVLDLMLPGMSGLDVCRRLKADPSTSDIPIIMVTARSDDIDVVTGLEIGADDGCFKSALESLRRCGGVLEHPAYSIAWKHFGLVRPRHGEWTQCSENEWCCQLSQAAYGHRARKLTWLIYVGNTKPPELDWSRPAYSTNVANMPTKEAKRTPVKFREELIRLARHSRKID